MEIGNISIHMHKWVNDSQGAVYCEKCRKFNGWKPGILKPSYIGDGITGVSGFGYLINGEKWVKEKEWEIMHHNGLYV